MKAVTLKTISLLCAVLFTLSFLCACDADPNVVPEEETTGETYEVIASEEGQEATEREGFHAYGTGKTDPVKVSGVEVNVSDFAIRSYELALMMAQSFTKPAEIPLDAAVQYAFLHVFFPDFHSINNKAIQYRSATEEEVRAELKKQFGTDGFPITESVFYNPKKKIFEMWTPEYGTNIYYNIDAVNINGDEAEIITTFYNELDHSTMLGRTYITVKIQDGSPVIAALKAE